MDLNSSPRTELQKFQNQFWHGIGLLCTMIVFWLIALGLFTCPLWLPALIDHWVH
jgi:hypothetical protein